MYHSLFWVKIINIMTLMEKNATILAMNSSFADGFSVAGNWGTQCVPISNILYPPRFTQHNTCIIIMPQTFDVEVEKFSSPQITPENIIGA